MEGQGFEFKCDDQAQSFCAKPETRTLNPWVAQRASTGIGLTDRAEHNHDMDRYCDEEVVPCPAHR